MTVAHSTDPKDPLYGLYGIPYTYYCAFCDFKHYHISEVLFHEDREHRNIRQEQQKNLQRFLDKQQCMMYTK